MEAKKINKGIADMKNNTYICTELLTNNTDTMNATFNYSEVYAKNYPSIVSYLNSQINNMAIAEDLAQDTFIKVWNYRANFKAELSDVKTWLRNIANRVLIDYYRTRKEGRYTTELSKFDDVNTGVSKIQVVDNSMSADSRVNNAELKSKLNKAFESLKPIERKVAEMRFIDELEYEEISAELGMPMGTVKSHIKRSKEKLQSQLSPTAKV